jgi:flavorubredoxin
MAITEIAPDLYRISTYIPDINLQFNQFLVTDDEPLLFHTGMNSLFPLVHEAVASVIDPATLRWISFSHFEADECGSLNKWLELAPSAQPLCTMIGAMVNINDFAIREARGMMDGEVLETGKRRFRFLQTPHVPHCWEAGLLFEETNGAFLCSDLFHQSGDVEPLTESDIIERARQTLKESLTGPFANYMPYTKQTDVILQQLAKLEPRTIVPMHGSAYTGNGAQAIRDLAVSMKEILG